MFQLVENRNYTVEKNVDNLFWRIDFLYISLQLEVYTFLVFLVDQHIYNINNYKYEVKVSRL